MGKIEQTGLTFDDVLLQPAHSSILPNAVDIHSRLTAKIRLNIPLVSAAMDTVTDSRLAIAVAREGGLGFIHKNMSPEIQANEVRIVKRSESVIIKKPFTLPPDMLVADALELMSKKKISGVPITESDKLVGILTNRDLRFQKNIKVPISSIMTTREKLITAPVGTTMDKAKVILHKHRIEKLPVVSKDGKLKGLITVRDILMTEKFPNSCKDPFGHLRVGAAVGVSHDTLDRIAELTNAEVDIICIDTAHGHSEGVLKTVKLIKKKYPNLPIVAGNVATYKGFLALAKAGADCIKVGIGPGSICTTRIVSGAGVPQITAIMECARAATETKKYLIADGGIRFSGDISKAIAAGADVVMIGGMLAGTEEAPGEMILYEGKTFKSYRGMGSLPAMKKGSKVRYFQEDIIDEGKLVPEGIEGRVPFKGAVSNVIYQLIGGLRLGMGYCGCPTIKEMQKRSSFIQVSSASIKENHPHDIQITREAPNYKVYY